MADNTAQQLKTDNNAAEPSMEEILLSIKRIIADDDVPSDGKTERERFTHPTDPSNSNQISAAASTPEGAVDVEAELKSELGSTGRGGAAAGVQTLEERAAQLRAQISAKGNEKSAEERLARFRSDSRLQMEELAERRAADEKAAAAAQASAAETTAKSADAPLSPFAPGAASRFNPMQSMMPTTDSVAKEMAAVLMRDKGHDLQAMIAEMMRPGISQWLTDNLPTIVEKLVREEIYAASRGK